ncbi:hypothetical protein MKW92_037593 [Papaver armeniacum]|nr:hypothetical protein MKW92_037593 [Papaver armeniacum]
MTALSCNVSNRAHGLCNEPEIWRNEGIPRDGFETCSSGYQKVEKINGRKVNGTYIERTYDRAQESNSWDGAPVHEFQLDRFVEGRFVYKQLFVIRSYEIGPDKTATMETLMNLLQETALNHVMSSGLAGDGFGATHEMSLRKLIWVVTRIHIQVEKYSSWYVVEVNAWVDAAGKNRMRREWEIWDNKTRQIITRARSTWVVMNRETRRLSKMPEQVRQEVKPFYLNRAAMGEAVDDLTKIDKLGNETVNPLPQLTLFLCTKLQPRWSDMDANQDVNNVKYIGWILESVPINVLEDYNLTSMTLEFRRECRQSNLLESLTHMEVIEAEETTNSESKTKADFRSTHGGKQN